MKRGLMLVILIGAFFISFNLVSAFSGAGDGTANSPFNITNCTQVQEIEDNLTAYYQLNQSINCSDTKTWNSGAGFEPIGTYANKFTGSFDGKGFNVTGLYIYLSTTDDVGLFGAATGGINNIGLIGINITGMDNVGGLVGFSNGNISNSYSTGNIYAKGGRVGGLVGNFSGSLINNSYSTGNVTGPFVAGYSNTGGLVGISLGDIYNSYSTGNITGNFNLGGLVGKTSGNIYNSYATGGINATSAGMSGGVGGGLVGSSTGNISGSYATGNLIVGDNWNYSFAGGLVGQFTGKFINNSYATGKVTSSGIYTGGLVGNGGGNVYNSYSTGNVTSTKNYENKSYTGGLIGYFSSGSGVISNSYSTGNVSSSILKYTGGLVGQLVIGTIQNSYWYDYGYGLNCSDTTQTSCHSISSEGISYFFNYDNAPMNLSVGTGWDFENGWSDNNSLINYPLLLWQTDLIAPDVAFVSPVNGITYTNSIVIVNITNSSDASSVWWYNGAENLTYGSTVTLTLPNGDYTFIAYANDSSGNLNQTSVNFTVNVAPKVDIPVTSGGYLPQTYLTDSSLSGGNSFNLWYDDKVNFVVNSANHILTMNSFNSTTAKILIESNPITAYLEKGILYEFDVDNDSVKDIRVRYDGLNYTKAVIFMQKIAYQEYSPEEVQENNYLIPVIIVSLIIIFALILIYTLNKRKRYRKKR